MMASAVLLIIGMGSPQTISKYAHRPLTRKNIVRIFGGLILVSFVGIGITAPPVEKKTVTETPTHIVRLTASTTAETGSTTIEHVKQEVSVSPAPSVKDPIPAKAPPKETTEIVTSANPPEQSGITLYAVTKVVDGDTFDVSMNGETKRIRLIGVDTPETVDPRKPVQCFGKEASQKAKELLLNKKVKLEFDPTQGEVDKYGRTLAYAFREDGLFYNKWIIENGYAHEYTYSHPYKYQQDFKMAENKARESKVGLWADNACTSAQEEPQKPTTAPVTQPPANQPSGSCVIKGNISSDKRKIYHLPGCGSYDKTVIDESAGEKWFCTEQEATNAGWVKAGNC